MLCITFDNFGCGSNLSGRQGKLPPCTFPDLVPPSEWDNYNEIGLTLGHPRILSLLKQLEIRTTFFAEGYAAVLHPDEMKRWADQGHEIALHGWKHEMWANLPSKEHEERLIILSMAAMTDLLGKAPVGFRPPGFKINPWTDDLLEKYGIKYVSQVLARKQGFSDRFNQFGITYAKDTQGSSEVSLSRLKILPCTDELTDVYLISPAFGGLLGNVDAETAYDRVYHMAVEHQRTAPAEPWVFTAHPFVSGNRAWSAFEKFMRRLRADFESDAFKTAHDIALGG
jgi:peptidoglycan-N-acetylglucosamine deacetylase